MNKNKHLGHRQRLKNRFLKDGLDNFEKHNVLELLLFYGIPQRDTNETAHLLLENFGSISGVLDASFDDLTKIDGVGDNAAALIKLIPELARLYMQDKAEHHDVYDTSEKLCEYFSPKFIGRKTEVLFVACFDNANKMVTCKIIAEGTLDKIPIPIEDIVKTAYRSKSSNIVLAHNHPTGLANPSRLDQIQTIELKKALAPLNIKLIDHIIVGKNNDALSMAACGFLDEYNEEKRCHLLF